MSSWMVTTLHHAERPEVPAVATRLPADEVDRYPRLLVRIEADGVVSTMVRMDDQKKDEAIAFARDQVNSLLLVLAGWLSVDGEPVRFEVNNAH